jgi:LysR family nitrogen assimilation transcriptional regulator
MATSLGLELIDASAIARSLKLGLLGQPPRKSVAERANRTRRVVLEVRQLEYFVAICDTGSMSKASAKLSVARSALSAQLALLEAELGVMLVRRLPSGVVPTESGRILYEHAQAILHQLRAAKFAVRQSGESPHGVIAVGIPENVSAVLGLPLLRAIKDRFPGITLQLHEDADGTVLGQLKDGRLDLAVVFSNGPLEGSYSRADRRREAVPDLKAVAQRRAQV